MAIKKITDTAGTTHDIHATYDGSGNPIDGTYVKKSGDTMTGSLELSSSSGDSPSLIFKRGTDSDNLCDWTIVDNGGYLIFKETISGKTTEILSMCGSGGKITSAIKIVAPSFEGALNGNATTATTATTANALADKSKGSAAQPVYINASGRPVACTCLVSKSVPSDAVFTDTKVTNNTTSSAYYLCGSTSSGNTTGTLVKRSDVYVDTSGNLNAKSFYVHASAKITSDASYNIFFNINGETPLVIANDKSSNMFVAPGSSYSNKYSLGTSTRKWTSVYATTFYGNLSGTATSATTATNVISNTTTSAYYLCGATSSTTNTSGTLVKRSTVLVNTSGNLYVSSGRIDSASGFYETSDERLKDFSNKIDVDLDKISKIKKHRFTWKDSENKNEEIGVSAQEIKELYPEIVSKNEEGYLSVAYDKLAVVALAAIDELHKKNKELEARIELLESKLLN